MFHSSLIFWYPFAPYHKADWAVWMQTAKAEIKSVIDDTSNQLLTQAVVLLTHEASKLESVPHSHAFN